MIKFYCDQCGKEIENGKCVKIAYRVVKNSRAIHENFMPGVNELCKDYCPECATAFVGQRTIEKTVEYNADRKKRMAGEED